MMDRQKALKEAKVIIKRQGGFNLIGKYYRTEEQKEEYLKKFIEHEELMLQAAREMLANREFN